MKSTFFLSLGLILLLSFSTLAAIHTHDAVAKASLEKTLLIKMHEAS